MQWPLELRRIGCLPTSVFMFVVAHVIGVVIYSYLNLSGVPSFTVVSSAESHKLTLSATDGVEVTDIGGRPDVRMVIWGSADVFVDQSEVRIVRPEGTLSGRYSHAQPD
jgi:hypothetical protein